MTTSLRSTFLILTSILCALAGCKPAAPKAAKDQTPNEPTVQAPADAHRPPSTADLVNFARSITPPVLKLVDLKNDPPVRMPNTAPGSNVWTYNVRVTFAPVEDELGPAPAQETQAFQALIAELGGLAAWSQAYASSPYASRYPGFTVDSPAPASPQLLTVLHPKDRPRAPIYGKMTAEWQVDHWEFSVGDAALPADDGSQFRSAFTGPVLIQGDPATDRFVTAAKAAVAEAKPKRQAIEKAYQEDLRKATQPGTVYKGTISFRSTTTPAEVRFIDPPGGDPNFARFEMRLPATGYVYTASAKLAARVPNLPEKATNPADAATAPVEPVPKADLTIGYENIVIPKPFPQNEFTTLFMYAAKSTRNAPLNVLNHQLKGQVETSHDLGHGFVLSAQQSP